VRTVFLGTSEFAVGVLDRLARSPHRPELVVTRPDRPRGRGRRLASPPVARAAAALGLELFQPESINDAQARARIAAARPKVVCVCGFGALIREPLLSDYTMLNVHPSLLPRWRGAAPIERAIMAGDRETGVSIMRVGPGLDSGPVCAQRREPIEASDTYGTLAARLQELGARLLVSTLEDRPTCQEQSEEGVSYAEKITGSDRLLDPKKPAAVLERTVRALTPHIGARLELDDAGALGILAVSVLDAGPPPGSLSLSGRRPVLGCAEGALELVCVHPPGRRPMSGEAYLRGRRER
jgi:methionyl-tRNA formyltransferase